MFQFRAFPSYAYLIQRTIRRYCLRGFPHSEISGSTDICSSPKLIAACHVLRRLLMPRHSPCALYSLTLRDILVLLFGIMQAINRLLSQNCNCYPHLFRCSTIKIHNSFQLPLKPSVALLSSHFNTLFSFQGAICSFRAIRCFASQNCNLLFWAFQLDHWEKDYMSRFARHWIVLSLWSQISKPNFLGSEIQQQIGFGGPEWARTTDLTIISRTL